ncbi:MAG: CocE/NonD family hydrolase C-terminal non-catalytic domain-containing protein [Steroidobacteraceae bacterium]
MYRTPYGKHNARADYHTFDAAPDGRVFNLMSPGLDVQRASYRDLARGRQSLEPGRIYEIDLNNLITSNTFLAGHRVRVQVFASFLPNFSRNLQNGKPEATSADARKATITIHADARHASRIILPAINP